MSMPTRHPDASGPSGADTDAPAQPLTAAPSCPKCGGRMWDNRLSKRNPKAPDFKCRDRRCDGVVWPNEHHAARPVLVPPHVVERAADATPDQGEALTPTSAASTPIATTAGLRARCACYLDVTEFVLAEVRPRYAAAGVPCTDATVAAIAATLFIGLCRARSQEGGR